MHCTQTEELIEKMEVKDMSEYMICYSVQKDPNRVINSDLRQAKVIEAKNEEEARRKLYEVEPRKINYISSIRIFTWTGEIKTEK